jgi:hypothetical protein
MTAGSHPMFSEEGMPQFSSQQEIDYAKSGHAATLRISAFWWNVLIEAARTECAQTGREVSASDKIRDAILKDPDLQPFLDLAAQAVRVEVAMSHPDTDL